MSIRSIPDGSYEFRSTRDSQKPVALVDEVPRDGWVMIPFHPIINTNGEIHDSTSDKRTQWRRQLKK